MAVASVESSSLGTFGSPVKESESQEIVGSHRSATIAQLEANLAIELQTDGTGNVITCPMTGWGIKPVAETMILLAIEYVDSPEQLETGERKQLQAILHSHQALELAEELKKVVALLEPPPLGSLN
jgi:hypothetical protein